MTKAKAQRAVANMESTFEGVKADGAAIWSKITADKPANGVWGEQFSALALLILTPHIRFYLMENDPAALERARRALGL